MRGPQTTPIDPGQTEFARGRLDVPRQNVIVSHGRASLDRLKDEILRAVQRNRNETLISNSSSSTMRISYSKLMRKAETRLKVRLDA